MQAASLRRDDSPYFPGGQAVGNTEPAGQYDPGGQGPLQRASPNDAVRPNVPGGQGLAGAAPPEQNDPGGHFKGSKLPSGQYSPAPPQAAEQPAVERAVTLP